MTRAFADHLVTGMDDIDMTGLRRRLERVERNLQGSEIEQRQDNDVRIRGADGTIMTVSAWPRFIRLRVDPSRRSSSMTITEAQPDEAYIRLPNDIASVRALVRRWLSIIAIPSTRHWGMRPFGEDPNDAAAAEAAMTLLCNNPAARHEALTVPIRNPYRPTDEIRIGSRPCFDRRISDRIVAMTVPTVMLSKEDNPYHDYALGPPNRVQASVPSEIDPIARLRILAAQAGIERPLLAAGRRAGSPR